MSVSEFFADLLMAGHALYSLFVLSGLVLILAGAALRWRWTRNPWFRVAHLMATLFVAVRVWIGLPCPFSAGEDRLRVHLAAPCVLGAPAHEALHRLAFRGKDPQRFAVGTTAFAVMVMVVFIMNRPSLAGIRGGYLLPIRTAATQRNRLPGKT